MAYLAPDPFRQAIRSGLALSYSVSASFNGSPVVGATDLRPTGGSITDTTKPGVRRLLNLSLAPADGLFDRLAPIGTELTVTCHVTYTDRFTVDIPMGVFDVDSEKVSEGGGEISLTAPDRWAQIQRARFLQPKASTPGLLVTEQISLLLREVIGLGAAVTITATSTQSVGALTWEKDRDKAIMELAESIGAWVYFDRSGVATIADVPTIGDTADWLIDYAGVLTELDRERSRTNTRNVVIVESSASDGEKFATQIVWDNDPTSPTYAGIDPFSPTNTPGPFGVVPYYYDTPILQSDLSARTAGLTILARVTGLASQVSLGSVPNPAIDAFDVLDVMPPHGWTTTVEYVGGDGFGTMPFGAGPFGGGSGGGVPVVRRSPLGAFLERHVVDTVTHPLVQPVGGNGGNPQHIDGRSTRTDDFS